MSQDGEMSALEAANYLREAIIKDSDLAATVAAIIDRSDCDDMYDWADRNPDEIKLLVGSLKDTDEQFDEFTERLASGDLT